ncbi:o-succinylbenzoate--CoA ligase, partial [Escherichia coli]|nr:o-succinylbenzoate--CoA ligase [Escherichia coli]
MIFSDWPWRHWRQVRGGAIALRLNDEQLNWRELCARVDELASGFVAQRVVEGSGVMLRALNPPQTLLAWLAFLQ